MTEAEIDAFGKGVAEVIHAKLGQAVPYVLIIANTRNDLVQSNMDTPDTLSFLEDLLVGIRNIEEGS